MIVNSVLSLIGNTPVIKINNIDTYGNEIYIKLEGTNPGGSTKDRIALKIIDNAIKENLINNNTTVIEMTSGNTGIGLAMVCAIKKIKLIVIMPDTASSERIKILRAYGAEVILTDGKLGMKGCNEKLEELKNTIPNHYIPNQFTNSSNPLAHYEGTAEEILKDFNTNLDAFFCGTGTGGTFSGVAKKLKEKIKNIKTFPVEPANSPLLSKGYIGSHQIEGMGMSLGRVPEVFNKDLADEIYTCDCEDAFINTKSLLINEGISAGISTGAVFTAALNYSKKNANKNLKILMISTDGFSKYLSKF